MAGRIKSTKKSNDIIGNRTRDIPACSIVAQPTKLPRAPVPSLAQINKEKMLNQLLIEMSEQLIESKKAVAMAIAYEKKLEREVENQRVQAQEWERKAMLAVQAGKDDLAKEALLRKKEYDDAYAEYRKQWEAQKASVDKLKESLKELQNKIEEAQRKKNLLVARAKRAEAQQKIQNTI